MITGAGLGSSDGWVVELCCGQTAPLLEADESPVTFNVKVAGCPSSPTVPGEGGSEADGEVCVAERLVGALIDTLDVGEATASSAITSVCAVVGRTRTTVEVLALDCLERAGDDQTC